MNPPPMRPQVAIVMLQASLSTQVSGVVAPNAGVPVLRPMSAVEDEGIE